MYLLINLIFLIMFIVLFIRVGNTVLEAREIKNAMVFLARFLSDDSIYTCTLCFEVAYTSGKCPECERPLVRKRDQIMGGDVQKK